MEQPAGSPATGASSFMAPQPEHRTSGEPGGPSTGTPPPNPVTGHPFQPAYPPMANPQRAATPGDVPPPQNSAHAHDIARQAGFAPGETSAPARVHPPIAHEPCEAESLLESIPKRMRAGRTTPIELRLRPGQLLTLADAGPNRPTALTLRLRAPGGDAVIETVSGETQWANIQRTGAGEEDILWRWNVTPRKAGRKPFKITIVSRTVGADALMTERTLPSQIKEVRIGRNWLAGFSAALKTLTAVAAGACAVLFAEPIWLYVEATLVTLGLR
jgi:hypothetical protein